VFGREFWGRGAAIGAILVLLSSFHFLLQFQLAVPDPYLVFFINGAFFSFFCYFKKRKRSFLVLLYLSMALGMLTKGPIAVVLPAFTIFAFLVVSRKLNLNEIKALHLIPGILLFLIITLPWHILVHNATAGEWTQGFFFKHNIERFSSTMEGHGGAPFYPFLFFFVGMLPFIFFLVPAFRFYQKKAWDSTSLYLSLIVVITLGFFSISQTQLPNYIVPAYPAFAILMGRYLFSLWRSTGVNTGLRLSLLLYTILMAILPFVVEKGLEAEPPLTALSELGYYFFILPLGGFTAVIFSLRRKYHFSILSLAVSWMLCSFFFFYIIFPKIDQQNPVSLSAKVIDKERSFAYFHRYNQAFAFFLKKPIESVKDKKEIMTFFENHPNGYVLTTKKKFRQHAEDWEGVETNIVFEGKDLMENPTTLILALDTLDRVR
jgi:4-amino-4-deoxy-L-arabinose transferase-like glycosyltransferase